MGVDVLILIRKSNIVLRCTYSLALDVVMREWVPCLQRHVKLWLFFPVNSSRHCQGLGMFYGRAISQINGVSTGALFAVLLPSIYIYIYIYIYKALLPCIMIRVGQNYIYTVYTRYFWQGNHQIYGHIRCIHTVLANPNHDLSLSANLRSVLLPFPFLVCFRAVL
jgi:hypothetical protein